MSLKQVLTTMLEVQLKKITLTNPYPKAESNGVWVQAVLSEIKDESFNEAKDGDLVINYDYWTDELQGHTKEEWMKGNSECEQWLNWYDGELFSGISKLMSSLGYEEVDDMDGSGGGLYYGCKLFRKK